MNDKSPFEGSFFLYFIALMAWIFFLGSSQKDMTNFGDIVFWAGVGSVVGTTGFILYDARTEWGSILILFVCSLLWGFYVNEYGYYTRKYPYHYVPDNMLETAFFGVIGGISIGSLVGGAVGYFLTARDRFFPQYDGGTSKADFESFFEDVEEDDASFKYDHSTFSQKASPPPNDAPRGYAKRHPDDAKLWAIVDDPASPDGERRNALEAIFRKQAKRES